MMGVDGGRGGGSGGGGWSGGGGGLGGCPGACMHMGVGWGGGGWCTTSLLFDSWCVVGSLVSVPLSPLFLPPSLPPSLMLAPSPLQ